MNPIIPIRERLFEVDPYEGFEPRESEVRGWNSRHEKLGELIREIQPKMIVEVGSWLGGSALFMTEHTDAHVLCIDTWTGAPEMWDNKHDDQRYKALKIVRGMPTIYFDFLSNVVRAGKQDQITPWPVPSSIALSLLIQWGYKPDLIYIDADHSYRQVKQDISLSAQLFPRIICGDDLRSWHGVTKAVGEWFPDANSTPEGFWWCDRVNRKTNPAIE